MTLGGIKLLALRQLDEDPQDIGEYDNLFKAYANMGYAIAVREYLRPREMKVLQTDSRGHARTDEAHILRVLDLRDAAGGRVPFFPSTEGNGICTTRREQKLTAICEISYPELEAETDEPKLPEDVHTALADYICYRHLSSGSLAKQNRAQFYLVSFMHQMRAIRSAGGSGRYKNLYEATACR